MLSYQHIYHAGNKADIHKHLWLITVLDYLRQKDKPFTWIDTHAGRGLYDLQSPEAQKLGEYKEGVLNVLTPPHPATAKAQAPKPSHPSPQRGEVRWGGNLPHPLTLYKNIVQSCNNKGENLRYYPGSALIAAKMLRPDDRLFAYDLHPQENKHLSDVLRSYQFVTTEKADGLERLNALTPPGSRRGGALIDPSYEIKKEYETVGNVITRALKKFPQGIFMIWYPMLKAGLHEGLKKQCAALTPAPLIDEWVWAAPDSKGMHGSGMIIFNPPYTAAETMQEVKALF